MTNSKEDLLGLLALLLCILSMGMSVFGMKQNMLSTFQDNQEDEKIFIGNNEEILEQHVLNIKKTLSLNQIDIKKEVSIVELVSDLVFCWKKTANREVKKQYTIENYQEICEKYSTKEQKNQKIKNLENSFEKITDEKKDEILNLLQQKAIKLIENLEKHLNLLKNKEQLLDEKNKDELQKTLKKYMNIYETLKNDKSIVSPSMLLTAVRSHCKLFLEAVKKFSQEEKPALSKSENIIMKNEKGSEEKENFEKEWNSL